MLYCFFNWRRRLISSIAGYIHQVKMEYHTICIILIAFVELAESRTFLMDSINECYHAWSERSQPSTCSSIADCKEAGADCIFSIVTNQHICCNTKQDAILPECPSGQKMLAMGKNNAVVCRGPDDSDTCSDDYECVQSVTNFTKNPGQLNFVCCK